VLTVLSHGVTLVDYLDRWRFGMMSGAEIGLYLAYRRFDMPGRSGPILLTGVILPMSSGS